MEINYYILGLLLLAVVVFLWFYFRRNQKDLHSLENTINASEIEPEEHSKDEDEDNVKD